MPNRFVVRYGSMRHLGEFSSTDLKEAGRPVPLRRGDHIVVRTNRGTEYGEILCESTEKTRKLLGRGDSTGPVLRIATAADERVREECWRRAEEAFAGATEEVRSHGLSMQLVDVEHLLGGETLTFFYTAESRVDFRELVKALARRFKTRIEMRQIGIRDEAKLLADYGDCGKPVCCNTHLRKMPPVSMKMAKLQKASLDPNKISGRCGRLKCCLRYEYDTYEEHQKELPKPGKWVLTKSGTGKVLAQEILAKKVLLAMEDGRRLVVGATDIVTIVSAPQPADAAATPARGTKRRSKTSSTGKPASRTKPVGESGAENSSRGENGAAKAERSEPTSEAGKPKRKRRKRRRKPKSDGGPSGPPPAAG